MNVSCTSCSAKYAVPDEKVRGKKVKITCKHCGTGIIVDGTKLDASGTAPTTSVAPAASPSAEVAPAAAAPAPKAAPAVAKPEPAPAAPAPAAAPAAAAPPPAAPEELSFDIAYPDDRQETIPISEIVDKYAAGTLDDDAFIWREGMADWKAPFDIPEIAAALTARGLSKRAAAAAPAPANAGSPFIDEDEATRVQASPFDDPSSSSVGVWREPAKDMPSSPEAAFELQRSPLPFEQPAEPSPTPGAATPVFAPATAQPAAVAPKPAATPKPAGIAAAAAAAKPAAARRSSARGGGDLFSELAAAGSEDDESLGAETKEAAPKLTGARNESSVLFSLDALVKQETKPAAKKKETKQEDAAALLLGDASPSSISNIGTGSFGAAFAAPDFTAPVLAPPPEVRASDPVELPTAAPQPAKKKGVGVYIGIAALVLLAGGAFAMKDKLMPPPAPTASATPPAPPKPEPAPTPAAQAPLTDAAPQASATPSAAPTPAPAAAGGAASKPADAAKPADKPADAAKPADKPADAAKPADKPAEPAASDAPPFNKDAAIAALSAAAGNAGSCKTPDGPTGSGKVSITFMPSGRATNTQVSGDLAGTAVGGCVARLFRSAKVPAFSGDPVTVSKSFSVQ